MVLKALANSKVKILGKDVVASFKILASIIILPTSIIIYTFLFYLYIRNKPYAKGIKAKLLSLLFLFFWPIYISSNEKIINRFSND
jgi:glycerol-3-phosphate O-acyltransferase/dihydroxyacetone phosphate acyltransferase